MRVMATPAVIEESWEKVALVDERQKEVTDAVGKDDDNPVKVNRLDVAERSRPSSGTTCTSNFTTCSRHVFTAALHGQRAAQTAHLHLATSRRLVDNP